MTETATKHRMMAEVVFPDLAAANTGVGWLNNFGIITRIPTVRVLAYFDRYDDDDYDFHSWIADIVSDHGGGEVVKSGLAPDDAEARAAFEAAAEPWEKL